MNAKASIFSQAPLDRGLGVRLGICRSCGAGIAVPEAARFCPCCGTTLRARGISPAEADALDRFAAIREAEQALPPFAPRPSCPPPLSSFVVGVNVDEQEELPPFARLADGSEQPDERPDGIPPIGPTPPPLPALPSAPLRNFHSDVLIAYASALFRLGWRYERGHGAPRNLAEAIRCYYKSARLGNRSAAERLRDSEQVSS